MVYTEDVPISKESIEKFIKKFPGVKVEIKEIDWVEGNKIYIHVSGLTGNSDLQLTLDKEVELAELDSVLIKSPYVFRDFLALKIDHIVWVFLAPITQRSYLSAFYQEEGEGKILDIGLNFQRNELSITIDTNDKENPLIGIAKLISGGLRVPRIRPIILKIENYTYPSNDGIQNDIRNILNSILFDVEYSYNVAFETVNIESSGRRFRRIRKAVNEWPKKKINLVYKKYIPELIQYFHIAEKVDFIPFKYICYYHIIEYFSDKSAYYLVSNEIKKILLKPDFHIKTSHYVSQAISLFKRENDKFTGDKIKIERVLRQYIAREELRDALAEINVIETFSKEITFECAKPLKLPGINFELDGNFFGDLTKRIYSIRCSIVHSNPEFDESKAIPFTATPANIDKLRLEMDLIKEIARKIIIDSKEENL